VIWNSGGGVVLVRLDTELANPQPFSYSDPVGGGWGFAWTNQP
jgi:hypothetical protein